MPKEVQPCMHLLITCRLHSQHLTPSTPHTFNSLHPQLLAPSTPHTLKSLHPQLLAPSTPCTLNYFNLQIIAPSNTCMHCRVLYTFYKNRIIKTTIYEAC